MVALGSVGLDLQRLAQGPHGAVRVVELLLVELGAAAEERHPRRRYRGAPRLLVDELAQIAPGTPALERRFVELHRRLVVGPRVEQAAVVLLGPPRACQLMIEISAVRRTMSSTAGSGELAVEVAGEQARGVRPAIELIGQAKQRVGAGPLGGRLLKDLAVPARNALSKSSSCSS